MLPSSPARRSPHSKLWTHRRRVRNSRHHLQSEEALATPEPRHSRDGEEGNIHKRVALDSAMLENLLPKRRNPFEDTFFYQGSTHLPIEQHAAVATKDPMESESVQHPNPALPSNRALAAANASRAYSRQRHAQCASLKSPSSRNRRGQGRAPPGSPRQDFASRARKFLLSPRPFNMDTIAERVQHDLHPPQYQGRG